MRTIGISGKLRSGKDLSASILMDLYQAKGMNVQHVHFSDKLYEVCNWFQVNLDRRRPTDLARYYVLSAIKDGVDVSNMYTTIDGIASIIESTRGCSINGKNRPMLREVAEYMRDTTDRQTWVKYVEKTVAQSRADVCIVSDMRHLNEADFLYRAGSWLIRIDVDPTVQRERMEAAGETWDPAVVNHITETALDDYPHFNRHVTNNHSIQTLALGLERSISDQHQYLGLTA